MMGSPVNAKNGWRRRPFSLMELMVAALVFALTVGPLVTMITDNHFRMVETNRRRTALMLADNLLTWAVNEYDSGSTADQPTAPSGFTTSLTTTAAGGLTGLELVTASATWTGHWGPATVSLSTLRITSP